MGLQGCRVGTLRDEFVLKGVASYALWSPMLWGTQRDGPVLSCLGCPEHCVTSAPKARGVFKPDPNRFEGEALLSEITV